MSPPPIHLLFEPGSAVTCDPIRSTVLPDSSAESRSAAAQHVSAPCIGLGGARGSINAAALLEAARSLTSTESDVVLLPLAGYDWLELLADLPGAVLARVPQVSQGSLVVLRRDRLLPVGPRKEARDLLSGVADDGARIHVGAPLTTAALTPFRLPVLAPRESELLAPRLEGFLAFDPERLAPVRSADDLTALRAGLFQLHDALERSHACSQSIEGRGRHQAGDYWHAIMHRRETDYGNARYWFRHVGTHPIHAELASRAAQVLAARDVADAARWRSRLGLPGRWDSAAFVDLCERATGDEDSPLGQVARRIQWTEMLLLLRSTCEDAYGSER